MDILVIGSKGFIGKLICKVLSLKGHQIYLGPYVGCLFDAIINANGNRKKYVALRDPVLDFLLSVQSVYKSLFLNKFEHYILISSILVWKENNYSFNKFLALIIIKKYCLQNKIKYNVLRPSAVIGLLMKKGVLKDILNNDTVFLTLDSKLQFITNTLIANIIDKITKDEGLHNREFDICGKGNVSVKLIIDMTGKDVKYNRELKHLHYLNISAFSTKSSKLYIIDVIKGLGNEIVERSV